VKALFDTNILVDYLAGVDAAETELGRYRERLISVVTRLELLCGARSEAEEDVIEMFLRDFRVVEITPGVIRQAVLARRAKRLRLPDAIVMASAQSESALLVTRNTKDFPPENPDVRRPY
jgi:predicted nucleic acid-binding protein